MKNKHISRVKFDFLRSFATIESSAMPTPVYGGTITQALAIDTAGDEAIAAHGRAASASPQLGA